MFATALARILLDRGYAVDVGGDSAHHDLAVLADAGPPEARAAVEIILPSLEGTRVTALVRDALGSRRCEVRTLEDLLALIEAELPHGAPVPGGGTP